MKNIIKEKLNLTESEANILLNTWFSKIRTGKVSIKEILRPYNLEEYENELIKYFYYKGGI